MKKSLLFCFGIGIGLGSGVTQWVDFAKAEPQTVQDYDPSISLAPLVEKMGPTVVYIEVGKQRSDRMLPGVMPYQAGQGSGFIISEDGYILTNNHVIEGADKVTVRLSNNESYEGTVVGTDDSTDVALIKIKPKSDLPFVKLGSSNDLQVGDWVVAIGNPFGLSHTVTAGIISAKGRVIGAGPYDDFLQTDASINPGNSGGPLFNLKGEVIGINTAIDSRAQGIGFSVPIDPVSRIIDDLKKFGQADRGWLGIALQTSMKTSTQDPTEQVVVMEVYPDTPASKGGLAKGDVITHIDGVAVTSSDELIRMVGKYRAGDKVKLKVIRNGKTKKKTVELGRRPTERDIASGLFQTTPNTAVKLGVQLSVVYGFDARNPSKKGLVVVSVDRRGLAYNKLMTDDVIVEANNVAVESATDLQAALAKAGQKVRLKIYRNGKLKDITINLK